MPHADSIMAAAVALTLAGFASAQTAQCAGEGTPIPDDGTPVSIAISVPAQPGALVGEVSVRVELAHEWLGDLSISVSHHGATALLIERVASDTWSYGCGGEDIDARFTGSAAIFAESLCDPAGPTPMFFGDILPAQPLSIFEGMPIEGDWTVTIIDHNPIDTGVIHSICVEVIPAPGSDCPGDVDGSGSVDLDDLNLVLTNFGQTTSIGDADGNGEVNLDDLNLVLTNFGTNC